MSGGIYLLREEDELVEMSEQAYDSESVSSNGWRSIPACWLATK
jgi:hypothetical protein